ncbi:MAG: asparaginase [Planctomycetes bacterium]|nr:asparaginase [Planctomycetota bacterium]
MSKPRIRLIFTGGTISMRDDDGRGAVPVLSGEDLLNDVPGLEEFCEVEAYDFGQLPGPHMTPARMMELSQLTQESLRNGFDAVVITHGTDTLEESAYLLDLQHRSEKPVVLVGAMRTSNQLSWDGPLNLFQACRVAVDSRSYEKGVLVVMNSTVYAAGEVTKTYTDALDTFQSPDRGSLGFFDGDKLIYTRPVHRLCLPTDSLAGPVGLVVASAGDDGSVVNYMVEEGYKGIVVEALGRGNLPPPMANACVQAIVQGLTVMLTSRCWGGRVSGTYGYEGGGARLMESGLVFAPGMPGHKARILLMVALGAGLSAKDIRTWLES